VETGTVRQIFKAPAHPYTRALLESIPRLGAKLDRLTAIEGQPPDLASLPPGCAFAPRCAQAMDRCRVEAPPEVSVAEGHATRCWLHT
jgi:oligopeptide/dipeptide ABC transporter ATP-binding protein